MLLCVSPREALVSIDSALHQGRTSVAAVARALPATAPAGRRLLLRLADGRAASVPETLARLALRASGLRVEVGVPITDVGFVDLLVDGRVVVELDGFAYHSGRKEFAADRRRDRELVARGFLVLRFTYADAVDDPTRVVDAVRAALASWPAEHGEPRL
jgi:very-short-patch-repair endonuclease